MRKGISFFLMLVLMFSMPLTVSAAPTAPILESDMPDCYEPMDTNQPIILFANFSSPDNGVLEYLWYSSSQNKMETIRAIDNATGGSYKPPVKEGVMYYCVAAWSNFRGEKSAPTYGRLIRVEYYSTAVEVVDIEVVKRPDKVTYNSGEILNLKGLHVRILTSEGYINSYNGEGLNITKKPLVTVGEQKIKLTYGTNTEVMDIFIVTVKEKPHTHSFGEWMTTTEPTCAEEGIKVRECQCGYTEYKSIPKLTEHTWDSGKEQDGKIVYICTVCGATKTVEAPYTSSKPDDPTANTEVTDIPTAGIETTDITTVDTEKTNSSTVSTEKTDSSTVDIDSNPGSKDEKASAKFPWWIVIVAAAVVQIGVGAVIFLIIKRKNK